MKKSINNEFVFGNQFHKMKKSINNEFVFGNQFHKLNCRIKNINVFMLFSQNKFLSNII